MTPNERAEMLARMDRLERENLALDGQVKLLVRTEQQLSRSQSALDAQIVRFRRLAAFSLASASSDAGAILDAALALLADALLIDAACVLAFGAEADAVDLLGALPLEPRMQLSAALSGFAWLRSLTTPQVVLWSRDDDRADASGLVAALGLAQSDAQESAPRRLAVVPIASVGDGRRGALIAFSSARLPGFTFHSAISGERLPFLELLATHVDRAIEAAVLRDRLKDQNARLEESLASLASTQRDLLQAQKLEAVGRLAGGIAHDFNNLLTVILSYAESLATSLPQASVGARDAASIVEAGRRAAELTAQLLAMSRKQVQRPEDLELSVEVERTLKLLRRVVPEAIEILLELGPGLAKVRADRAQLQQVLLNLVLNARDAMRGSGVLRVVTRVANDEDYTRLVEPRGASSHLVLEVVDDGSGMDSGAMSRLFEPFYTTKAVGEGTGLGLAVVYGIVKQTGGHILVDSEVGEGSRFRVLWPCATSEAPPREVEEPAPLSVRTASWLIVEDEPAIRRVLRSLLEREGHRVHVEADGEAALAWIAQQSQLPDAVLADTVMPRVGGLALAARLRRDFPSIRVALMSGYADELTQIAHEAPPLAGVLSKPFTKKQLLGFVERVLASPLPARTSS